MGVYLPVERILKLHRLAPSRRWVYGIVCQDGRRTRGAPKKPQKAHGPPAIKREPEGLEADYTTEDRTIINRSAQTLGAARGPGAQEEGANTGGYRQYGINWL